MLTLPKAIRAISPSPVSPIAQDDNDDKSALVLHDVDLAREQNPKSPRSVHFRDEGEAPVKPPRPLSPQQQALITLIEAFPSIDGKVVKAVLTASGGQLEPAFNALLGSTLADKEQADRVLTNFTGMSDPDFQEEQPPPRPPRPVQQERQISQDEMYARHLNEHYQAASTGQQKIRQSRTQEQPAMGDRTMRSGGNSQDRDYSFFDGQSVTAAVSTVMQRRTGTLIRS